MNRSLPDFVFRIGFQVKRHLRPKYKNSNDWHFFRFTGIDPAALQAQVVTGAGDWDVLTWINENAPLQHTPLEISQWSDWTQTIAFHDVEMREW